MLAGIGGALRRTEGAQGQEAHWIQTNLGKGWFASGIRWQLEAR